MQKIKGRPIARFRVLVWRTRDTTYTHIRNTLEEAIETYDRLVYRARRGGWREESQIELFDGNRILRWANPDESAIAVELPKPPVIDTVYLVDVICKNFVSRSYVEFCGKTHDGVPFRTESNNRNVIDSIKKGNSRGQSYR